MEMLKQNILFIFTFLVSFQLFAQNNYEGTYKLTDTITGFAKFQFEGSNSNPIFADDFKFDYAKKFGKYVKSIHYQGQFKDNKKQGNWLYSKKSLVSRDTIIVEGYQISYPASGFEHKVEALFENGNGNGKWIVVEQNFENAKPTDTIFSSSVAFDNSVMSGRLLAKSKDFRIQGNFNQEGVATGEWLIKHQVEGVTIDEVRVYDNGVFIEHLFRYNNETYEIKHLGLDVSYEKEEDNWVIIDINDAYFNIFELSNFGFESDIEIGELKNIQGVTKKSNNFMRKAITSFAFDEDFEIWNQFTEEQKIKFGKFKVRKFVYSDEEQKKISEIKEYQREINTLLNNFYSNSQVEIGRLNFKDLNKYYKIFEKYNDVKEELEDIQNKLTNPALEYLERGIFMKNFATSFSFPEEINFIFKDESFLDKHEFPSVPSKDEFNISLAHTFFKNIVEDIRAINDKVDGLLDDLEKQEELNDLEKELVSKRNEIQKKFNSDNNSNDYNTYHKSIQDNIQILVEEQFKSYASLSLNEKKEEVDNYIVCFDSLLDAYDFFAELPRKVERIDDEYTRVSFNAFIMVDMEERVKERLYNAFTDIAFPYLLDTLNENLTCDTIENNLNTIESIYFKMIELRETDTQDLERKLRRVRNPQEVLSILELETKN
jgi:hypothetical protein